MGSVLSRLGLSVGIDAFGFRWPLDVGRGCDSLAATGEFHYGEAEVA